MLVDLVRANTADGVRLDGILLRPPAGAPKATVDAAIFVHGVGGNFYGSPLWDAVAPELLRRGIAAHAFRDLVLAQRAGSGGDAGRARKS